MITKLSPEIYHVLTIKIKIVNGNVYKVANQTQTDNPLEENIV